jgi:hypothetical protein
LEFLFRKGPELGRHASFQFKVRILFMEFTPERPKGFRGSPVKSDSIPFCFRTREELFREEGTVHPFFEADAVYPFKRLLHPISVRDQTIEPVEGLPEVRISMCFCDGLGSEGGDKKHFTLSDMFFGFREDELIVACGNRYACNVVRSLIDPGLCLM